MNKNIGFQNELKVKKSHIGHDGHTYYELLENLIFFNGTDNIEVKAVWNGETFMTNLASTPKRLRWLLPPDKKLYKRASVLHDWLYSHRDIKRRYADKMFLLAIRSEMRDLLVEVGNPRTKFIRRIRYSIIAYAMYLSVRLFGKAFKA